MKQICPTYNVDYKCDKDNRMAVIKMKGKNYKK